MTNFSHGRKKPISWKNLQKIPVGKRAIDGWTKVKESIDQNGEIITLWSSPTSTEPHLRGNSYVIDIQRPSTSGLSDYCDEYRLAHSSRVGSQKEKCNKAMKYFEKIISGELNSTNMLREVLANNSINTIG